MTDEQFTEYVRSLINEPTAKFWQETEINSYKAVAITHIASLFVASLAVTHKKATLADMIADDPYITKAGETEIEYWKPVRIEYASNGEKLPYIKDSELWKYDQNTPGTPQVWMFEDNKVRQVPTPSTTSADYWRFFYLPKFDTLAKLPEELHALVAIETVMDAKSKDERLMKELQIKWERFYHSASLSLAVPQYQEADIMDDFTRDEDYD